MISAVHGGCATSAKEKETLLLAARRTRRAHPRPHVATQAPRCGSRAPPRAPLQRCGAQLRREGEVLDVGVQEKAHRRPEVGRGDAPVLPAQPHRRRLLWCKSACSASTDVRIVLGRVWGSPAAIGARRRRTLCPPLLSAQSVRPGARTPRLAVTVGRGSTVAAAARFRNGRRPGARTGARRWRVCGRECEWRRREEADAKNDVTKKKDMSAFYRGQRRPRPGRG